MKNIRHCDVDAYLQHDVQRFENGSRERFLHEQ